MERKLKSLPFTCRHCFRYMKPDKDCPYLERYEKALDDQIAYDIKYRDILAYRPEPTCIHFISAIDIMFRRKENQND